MFLCKKIQTQCNMKQEIKKTIKGEHDSLKKLDFILDSVKQVFNIQKYWCFQVQFKFK